MRKSLIFFLAILFMFSCGKNNDAISPNMEKTAKVNVSFHIPDSDTADKSVISNATTHIIVYAHQYDRNNDGTVKFIYKFEKILDTNNSSAIIDLYPTYTNICASQWSGEPTKTGSRLLETVCTYGKLVPGNNPITIRMIRGTWTLNTPYAFSNNSSLQEFVLTRMGYRMSNSPEIQSISDVVYNYNNQRGMAKYALGSEYNVALKINGKYSFPRYYYYEELKWDRIATQSNFFNVGNTSPLFFLGKDLSSFVDGIRISKGFSLFSLPKKTDSDGWFRQKYSVLKPKYIYNKHLYPIYPNVWYNQIGVSSEMVWGDMDEEVKIEKYNTITKKYEIATSNVLDQCVSSTASSNQMTLCALKEDSIKKPSSFSQYSGTAGSYKVTAKIIMKGIDICINSGQNPIFDDKGDVIGCYNNDYYPYYLFNQFCAVGTFNSMTGKCEFTPQEACIYYGGSWYGSGCYLNNVYLSGSSMCTYNNDYSNYTYDGYKCYVSQNVRCKEGWEYKNGRCESSLEVSCHDGNIADPDVFYDDKTKACIHYGVAYVGDIKLTPLTATGVGSLPSEVGFSGN